MGRYMTYYCSLSLPELRRRQQINKAQTVFAYTEAQRDIDGRPRYLRGLIRLQRIYGLLTAAIMKMYA